MPKRVEGSIPTLDLNNFAGERLDETIEEKRGGKNAIAIPLLLCFSSFVPLRRFRESLTKPFYFYLSRTCDSPGGTPSVISIALRARETPWRAREMASVTLSAERERRTENVFHMLLRGYIYFQRPKNLPIFRIFSRVVKISRKINKYK